jgi:hypothetical protein
LQSSLTKVALFLIAVSSIKMSRHWSCSSLTKENRIELPNRRAGQSGSFARKAVAELVPEILEISGLLRHGRAEALKRWLGGPDIAVKLDFAFFGIERDQQYVVDGLRPVVPL